MRTIIINSILAVIFLLLMLIIYILVTSDHEVLYSDFSKEYTEKYDPSDYVSEELEGSKFTHNLVMNALYNSNEFLGDTSMSDKFNSLVSTFTSEVEFDDYIKSKQYVNTCDAESKQQYIQSYESNVYYEGCLSNGETVKGNISVYEEKHEFIFVLSFVDKNGDFDLNKLELLADDSNAEQIVYDVIMYLQYVNKTNMEPNIASQYYFKSSIEEVAGSISYHAAIALYLLENDINNEVTLKRLEQVNISTKDADAIVVNHKY